MALKDELAVQVREFTVDLWGDVPDGNVVPTPEALTFGNTGVRIWACVLYADLHGSTAMVDALSDTRAAEYYKAFLHCAAKIVRANEGEITAYDGDRIMAIYKGDGECMRAVQTAMQINAAVSQIINPQFSRVYGINHRPLQHTVGIDYGQLLAAKTGVRVDSDLVWVGPAANYAAKLNSFDGLDVSYPTRITARVHQRVQGAFHRIQTGSLDIWNGPFNNLKTVDHYRMSLWMEIE